MIFSDGIRGMGYAPDDEDLFGSNEDYNEDEEDATMERYYEEKYNN